MFYQFKLTFVFVLYMTFCLESQAVSVICNLCRCTDSQKNIDCSSRGLTSVPQPIPPNVVYLYLHGNNIKNITEEAFQHLSSLTTLDLRYNNLNEIKAETFQNLSSLKTLYLQGNNIKNITEEAFQHLSSLTTLDLRYNNLNEIKAETFQNLSSLKTLYLQGNNIKNITEEAFQHLSSLTTLDLRYNNLNEIKAETFQNLSSLKTLDLYGNNIKNIAEGAFRHLTSLTSLDLRYNNLNEIKAETFQNLSSLKTLDLYGNNIKNIAEGAFRHLTSLTSLDLRYNNLNEIKAETFQNLSSLKTLYLYGNNINNITEGAFQHLSSLTTLNLGSNGLNEIKAETFQNLSSLTYLDLSNNGLDEIKAETFQYLSSLTTLDLQKNNIKNITEGAFQYLSSLTSLNLRNNNITKINGEAFRHLSSLTSLNLYGNNIKVVKPADFQSLSKLTRLILWNNKIEEISVGTFKSLSRLTYLDLDGNAIREIKSETFQNLSSLGTLDLRNNDIKEIKAEAFQHLPKLTHLYLQGNKIETIGIRAFHDLPSLSYLDLRNNDIKEIKAEAFQHLPKLTHLDLRNNDIKEIKAEAFQHLPKLTHLDLRNNDIKEIKAEAFQHLPKLTHLYLQGNKIETIGIRAFHDLPSLSYLDLRNNDIKEIKAEAFQHLPKLTHLYLQGNKIETIGIRAFHDLPSLSNLDLRNNDIKEIKAEAFQHLPKLTHLYLQGNKIETIGIRAFHDLPSLSNLFLQDNNTTSIQRGIFENVPSLEILNLYNNQIQKYEDGAFLFLPSINNIYLGNNTDMMCGCHLPALVNYTKRILNRNVNVFGECQTDLGNNQSKVISIMEYSQCQNYSLFQRNLQCQTCSGIMCDESQVTNCTGDEPVCENKITMNGVTLKFEKPCSTYRNCLAALRNNTFTCNRWTSGASCVSCCSGNLCNKNDFIGGTNFFVVHLIYNSTFKKANEYKPSAVNVSRTMEYELSNLAATCEVEYCGLEELKDVFSINCSVPDNVTKDEVFKQIFETLNSSKTLRNLGIKQNEMELIGEMVCNENTTSTNSHTFYWPMTKVGTNVTIPCGANTSTRYCSAVDLEMQNCSPFTGIWQEPDMSQCYTSGGTTEKPNNLTRWTNSFLFHLIYNSTFKNIKEDIKTAENVSRAMEYALSNVAGTCEVEYCGLEELKDVFSINCSVPDNVTKDEVFKQIFETLNSSKTLRNLGIKQDEMELIGEMVCNENTTSTNNGTFYWPMTKVGTNVSISCHANVATRPCFSGRVIDPRMPTTSPKCSPFTGVWQEPDMSQCYNTEGITEQLKNLTSVDIGKENVEKVSTILRNISKKSVYFKAKDIDLAVEIHEKMVPLISNVSVDITVNNILPSINDIINTPEEVLDETEESEGTGKRMLDIIEAIAEKIPLEEQRLTAVYSNLGIGAMKVEKDTFNGAAYGISFGNKENEAKTMIYNNSNSDPQVNDKVDFISLARNLLKHLKTEDQSAVSRISFFAMQEDKLYRVKKSSSTKANTKINSNIIAANIPNIKITNLDEPVNISFNLINPNTTNPQCVYWDESPGQNPHWSTKGCSVSKYVPGEKALCSCNHLTSFALLMNLNTDPPTSLLSYIGCAISFVCLILTAIIHVCSKNLRKLLASKVLVNLCVSLAIANLIFLVGMQPYASEISAACKAVAALLHYFLLTSLMWMAVEAFHVCLAAVIVFKTYQSHFVLKSSIFAWGLPAVVVIITLAINYTNNYIRIERAQVCWLSGIPFYAAFLAPVVTIVVFNFTMFLIIIGRLITMQSNKLLAYETRKLRLFGIAGLIFLFGLSWVFAFFAVGEAAGLFEILFVIFNTFQGTFIFLFYCIYKKDTRDVICKCFCKQKKEKGSSKVVKTNKSSSSGNGTAETNS